MKSTNATRQQLLDCGLIMAKEAGLRALTVRGLCQRAGVNPGSFVYHFGSRERYLSELLEHWYAPLFQQLQWQQQQQPSALPRLQAILRQLLDFITEHGGLIAHMLLDAAAGEAAAQAFLSTLAPRHPKLLLQSIVDAQQAGELERGDPLHQALFLMSALGLPALAQHIIAGKPLLPDLIQQAFNTYAIDPRHIEQRLQWALRGLRPLEPQP
ncbi:MULTISPECIES: TetR/AcrR family transcriptional regulator [Chromobacterium]|uniref:TetR/AcrR family transcriptional regulator n=2 Tax=Chromobacterium TaxID=535 RepID=A0ABS3GNY0_9NEIS|nr:MULTISPECIES: TetR/AcrR family transcriptional regulator [Chromobacterium]AXT48003.1 TetR/AcrR family transcriptional regulator [Chromobacterium rhizoryzae]MBK0415031.1 TetR/AcrR family transcriptional regulator [Chromobacterium haemolyticum]MBO0416299.1 TetR/AcrR family transcriptional regulator [Chromobacterium haemolyticum]MBO0499669.1 TetR/AcrR family transcriptional regulator [Chromobacterium haemolyticum]MDH0342393.1 TetR/AcrR family transcriptional regulator [Chromobacterium haemolyt